jgi:hypothetical protein
VRGRPDAAIMSRRGARQGNPLGTLLFALTLQRPLGELQQIAQPVTPLAYADDMFLQGCTAEVLVAFPDLCQLVAPLGLMAVLEKALCTQRTRLPWPRLLHR